MHAGTSSRRNTQNFFSFYRHLLYKKYFQGCIAPPVVSNSRIEGGDQFTDGDEILYVCNKNFKLIGSGKSVCKSGRWIVDDGQLPQCVKGEIQ